MAGWYWHARADRNQKFLLCAVEQLFIQWCVNTRWYDNSNDSLREARLASSTWAREMSIAGGIPYATHGPAQTLTMDRHLIATDGVQMMIKSFQWWKGRIANFTSRSHSDAVIGCVKWCSCGISSILIAFAKVAAALAFIFCNFAILVFSIIAKRGILISLWFDRLGYLVCNLIFCYWDDCQFLSLIIQAVIR